MIAAEHAGALLTATDTAVRGATTAVETIARTVTTASPTASTAALLDYVPDVIAGFGDLGATLAADWYTEVRSAAEATGRFRAPLAPATPADQIDAMIRWAAGPLFADDLETALARLLAGSARLVRDPARRTVEDAALADPAAGAYIRVVRPDACPFCLMLAARGATYATRESAISVGAGRRGVRGSRAAGQSFHDHCRCTAAPMFAGETLPEFHRSLASEWKTATRGLSGDEARRAWAAHLRLSGPT